MIPLLLLPALFADLTWEVDYEAARERATEEERVLFVAVHSDEEARSEAFWKKVYKDKAIKKLAEETVNMVACLDVGWKKRCASAKAAGMDEEEAKFIEAALREEFLAANSEGIVASPQHLWIDSKGAVLLCVPFEMEAEELAWCFAEAARLAGTSVPEVEGRAPRRLLYGSAYQPPSDDEYGRGLRADEVEEKLDELRASMGGGIGGGRRGGGGGGGGAGGAGGGWGRRIAGLMQLAFTDEPDAQKYVALELGSGLLTWRGYDPLVNALHGLGNLAPASAWEIFESYSDHREAEVRNESAVAAEQLGTAQALKTVKSCLKREKDPLVEKNWLRALGAVAGTDKGARKMLLGASEEDDALLRRNALFALGWLPQGEDVRERLLLALEETDGDDVRAAACAMALSRDEVYLPVLQKRAQAEGLAEATKAALTAAVGVIEGGGLASIESAVREACRDRVARERVFFRQVSADLGGRGR
jgi:hypothetical protein